MKHWEYKSKDGNSVRYLAMFGVGYFSGKNYFDVILLAVCRDECAVTQKIDLMMAGKAAPADRHDEQNMSQAYYRKLIKGFVNAVGPTPMQESWMENIIEVWLRTRHSGAGVEETVTVPSRVEFKGSKQIVCPPSRDKTRFYKINILYQILIIFFHLFRTTYINNH